MHNDEGPPSRPLKSSLRAALDSRSQTSKPAPKEPPKKFQTPEEAAAADDIEQPAELVQQVSADLPEDATVKKKNWRDKLNFNLSWPPGKKEWIIIAIVVVLAGGVTGFLLTHHSAPNKPSTTKSSQKAVKKSNLVPSTLTGLLVDPSVNKRPVTAVMIENSPDARPQSGLSQAGVVFEAVAEGGVTRFMAVFQDQTPDNIGPIRSARPYYVAWAMGFDAGYAHVGGSPDGLADIQAWGTKDLDEFANGGSYHRIDSRAAPHNVYTSLNTLIQLQQSKGYTSSTYTGFPRKKEAPMKTPVARSINLTMSGPLYDSHFDYNAKTNSYDRSEGGSPQIDANTNKQLSPKVVIAIVVPETQGVLDASGAYYSDYQFIGSGTAYVYQDGNVVTGTWTKAGNSTQITFVDAAGNPTPLNPGQTWITAVTDPSKVSSSP